MGCDTMQILDADSIGKVLRERIKELDISPKVYDYGEVTHSGDSVVWIHGLNNIQYGELLEFDHDTYGMALDLSVDAIGAVLLDNTNVSVGSVVKGTGRVVEVPVGDSLLGRIVDPIGRPLDGKPLRIGKYRPIEAKAPSIMQRQNVSRPLETGLLTIDSMIPIGRGQRELIIGDRQTGKTTIAIDTILNQKGKNVICVYAAIGQKASTIAQVAHKLDNAGALSHTIIVAATASDSAAMQYITPYAACAIAEEFMYAGRDVLIVYDDLSKHAVAYRTMSLLLRRPTGREAYPGDVFYLHSRLLERSAMLNESLGGGSLSALPIVETMAGDISAYIPTNVISITDGQIYLESELFQSGMRPAINVGLSVSRVGRSAQHAAMRDVSSSLRLDLAQYRELAVFSRFSSDIDSATKKILDRGDRLSEALKQDQSSPLLLSEQVTLLLAYATNALSMITTDRIQSFKSELLDTLRKKCTSAMRNIDATGDLKEQDRDTLTMAIKEFASQYADK